ncbi:MAG TPA: hypothetical protein VJQ09_02450, partial [Candidatus Limnocylindria bacterium]|nr:hypothetical protein [Candidatus Limnocylindria bacterium]
MNVLYLSIDFVVPADRGDKVRTLAQLRTIASLTEVERIRLFFLYEDAVPIADQDTLVAEIPKIEIAEPVFHPIHLRRHLHQVPSVIAHRARGVPYLLAKWESPSVRERLRRELAARRWDVVWLNGLGIARYLPLVREIAPGARVVMDGHNVESD